MKRYDADTSAHGTASSRSAVSSSSAPGWNCTESFSERVISL
jgi:hypothetical protein